jgi:UDP-N-acetylmuramoylalanine--D-glutamate ligase
MSYHGTSSAPRRVLVVGMGVSGRSVCELLLRRGVEVIATDLQPRARFGNVLDHLAEMGCLLRLGSHSTDDFLGVDQIVVSPGVPLDLEPLKRASEKGVEIVGELDWAWRQVDVPVVAVTGTNGKTTTTSLIGEMLRSAGKSVFVGGNIGTPLSRWILDGEKADCLVLEVSSFQLDTASKFCPEVGVLLNVTADHLDRYENFDAYADSKFSIFSRQNGTHLAVVNGDDPVCRDRLSAIKSRVFCYSRRDKSADATIRDGQAVVSVPGGETLRVGLERCPLKGAHNEENILAAVSAAARVGASGGAIQAVIDRWAGLPHRVEYVGDWKGIAFYDDSKGTNVGAVVKALEGFDRPVLLLAGGRDKLGSYAPLLEAATGRAKAVFAFGEAGPRMFQELKDQLPALLLPDLESAFNEALKQAVEGDVVLLSPACSSFDQYESYAARGDHFKRLVTKLGNNC